MSDAADKVNRQPVQQPLQAGASSFEQVCLLCDSFSIEFASKARPTITNCLAQVSKDVQPTLLRNLLKIEIERRRGAGEQPNTDEYIEQFPEHETLVRHAFVESSTVSMMADGEDTVIRALSRDAPAVSRLGPYQLIDQLGRGGMGLVYEAVHMHRGDHVALKTLPHVDGDSLQRFKREFRSLADINHPHLIGLHSLEADGAQWFITMDLIDGGDFLNYVRPQGALDEVRLRSAFSQLVTGVMALHGNHIIHRDLKPANVMVTAAEGRVILLDFGLVFQTDQASQTETAIAGTVSYMAPEQAAGQKITAAVDWYAVGVMLYEALTGLPPFQGSAIQVLQDKQRLDPPSIAPEAGLPKDLVALCIDLLLRDPQQRPDALAIAKVAASAGETQVFMPAAAEVPLVGRERQLAALEEADRTVREQQEPLAVFVSGRSGEGKTSLAEHFLEPLRGQKSDVTVLSGRCYDRESVPFKALDNLVDALSSYLRSLADTDAALLMPKDIGFLGKIFPVLQRVAVVTKSRQPHVSGLDEQQVRKRAFNALRELLWRMSDRAPIILFIDDLQWGDADSAEALFEVLRPPESPVVLLLGTYRSDETEGSSFLNMWEELQRKHDVSIQRRDVSVGPLAQDDCTELVISLLEKDSDLVRRRAQEFYQETGGNPFLLIELVSCFDPETDSFQVLSMHEVIDQKLGRLPPDAGRLLEVVAVSGQALSMEEASRTADHPSPPISTLTHMRNERLVRLVGSEEDPRVDTYHDRIRETVLDHMPAETCKSLHRTLAEVIEATGGGISDESVASMEAGNGSAPPTEQDLLRVYDLAYHFDAAGERRKAWVYGLLAAEQARRQFAPEIAAEQYAVVNRNVDDTSDAIRYRVARGHGEALMLLGRYAQANEQLDGTIDLTQDVVQKAKIEALQGEIAFKQGTMTESITSYESGLRRLGNWVPRTLAGSGWGLFQESLVQCVHSLFPMRLHRKSSNARLDLTIELCNGVCHPTFFQSTLKLMWFHLSGLNRAELIPPSPGLALSSSIHGMAMSMLGWHRRGPYFSDRAMALARELDDLLLLGNSYNYSGIGHHASARFEEGLAVLEEAIACFEKVGDIWMINIAHFHRGCCHFGLGNLVEAIAEARWTFASSARIGDSRTMCSSYLWARAARGDIPFEKLQSCFPNRPDDVMSTVHGVMAGGHWHSFHGRTEEAVQAFERAGELVRNSHCVNSHTILVLPNLAAALRQHADAVQSQEPLQSEQLRKRALRLARWAVRITRLFPAAYPQSLRELSLLLAAKGKTQKAMTVAEKSCIIAERQKAKYEHAQSALVRARLRHQLKMPNADNETEAAEAELETFTRTIEQVGDTSLA